jgi:hypothetical protein
MWFLLGKGAVDVMKKILFAHFLALLLSGCVAFVLGSLLLAPKAQAYEQVLIRDHRAPMTYDLEVEPHLILGTAPPGAGAGSGAGIGVRGSLVILPEGFLPRVNDSVAVGVGLDISRYHGSWAFNGYRDQCLHYEPGPNGTSICTDVTSNGGVYNYVFIPVVMQWNFWLTRHFSAFGEPGVDFYFLGNHGFGFTPSGYIGGRVQLTDRLTLTGRVGYPSATLGVSFMM